MKLMPNPAPFTALALALLLGACSSNVKLAETPVETRSPSPVQPQAAGTVAPTPQANPNAAPSSRVATVDLTKPASPASADNVARVVYFDFDSFVIKDEFKPVIEGNAKAMASASAKRYAVEGHTDERGGREYNLALGQKRAEAVVKSLSLLGVNATRVEAVSFGEERPAAQGSDENAWSKNRRAELKDR